LNDRFVLQHSSFDGYLFLRFFRFIITICFVGSCITWPVLFPVNAAGNGGASQLDIISFSNIDDNKRLYAHALVAWLFLGFVMIWTARERLFLIGARQAYLLSKNNASRLSQRVVLFLDVPNEALETDQLHMIFGKGAEKSWPAADLSELESVVDERNDKATSLEVAEVKLSKKAAKKHHKQSGPSSLESGDASVVEGSERPSQKLVPIAGEKVDTLECLRKELLHFVSKVTDLRKDKPKPSEASSCAIFVAYKSQAAAQEAYRQINFHPNLPTKMRFIGVQPKEVIWKNVTLSLQNRLSKASIATVFITALIIFWSIPVTIVGTLSNINYITDKVKFLRFINDLPPWILGLITGLLPPYLLSTLVSYVPKFMRNIAKLSGEPTLPEAELKTQVWYFIFQVIQVFLITTFSSGAAAVATRIAQDPTQVSNLLAENLPKASNFYLSYFILQGIAGAPDKVLNYSDLFEYLFYSKYIDKTPREKYKRFTTMKGIPWATQYPKFVNFLVIAVAYSCIAPLVLGFATVGLYLFYLAFSYNMLYVYQVKVDSKGDCYARALQHVMTGVYMSELCLIGLCGARKCVGPQVLLILLLVLTVIYHTILDRLLTPLELYLPTVTSEAAEEEPLLAAEEARTEEDSPPYRGQGHHIHAIALPSYIIDRAMKYMQPFIDRFRSDIAGILHDPTAREEDPPEYTEDQLRDAYLNPALTSKVPKLWLARDEAGVSKKEIEANKGVGIEGTDEGAWFNERGEVEFERADFGKVPLFKKEEVRF
jgi:calcium permeable stress-gated cation channel